MKLVSLIALLFLLNISPAHAVALAHVKPEMLRFSTQTPNTVSDAQVVVISNVGNAPLTISAIKISAEFSLGDACFTEGGTCNTAPAPLCPTLAPGAGCTLNVWYLPRATPGKSGTLQFTTNAAPSGNPATVQLYGKSANVTCASIDRGTTAFTETPQVGSTSTPQIVTLKNGSSPRPLAIATSGDFSQTNNCDATLKANSQCDINVSFAPTQTGDRSGRLSFDNNDYCEIDGNILTGKAIGNNFSAPAAVGTPVNPTAPTALDKADTTTDVKGCTLGKNSGFDPVLILLAVIAAWRVTRRRVKSA